MPFHVTKYVLHGFVGCANDHVYMVTHDYPGIHFQSFIFNTIVDAIDQNTFVFSAGKYVYPSYH